MEYLSQTKLNATKAFNEINKLFLEKLDDYGTADMKEIKQITDRMKEKISRIENLLVTGNDGSKIGEAISDTFKDLSGYAVIGYLLHKKEWIYTDAEDKRADTPVEDTSDKILIQRNSEAKEFRLPKPAKDGDVGFDLFTSQDFVLRPDLEYPVDVPTGVRIKLPASYWALIINRSSTPRKIGIEVVNGVIDNGYTGELFACCYNRTFEPIVIKKGTRLAQFLIFKSNVPDIIEVDSLPETERGETGFGSSGI